MKGKIEEYKPGKWRIRFPHKGQREDIYSIEICNEWHPLTKDTAEYLQKHLSKVSREPGFDMSDYLKKKDRPFEFRAACDLWLKLSDCSPEWAYSRKKMVEKYFKPFFLGFDIRDVKSIHINEFLQHLRKANLSSKTIHNQLGELKAMFRFHRDSIPKIPTFPRVAFQEPTIKWLNAEQQEWVFENIPKHDKPIFTFMRWTGCRPNEAGGLLRENVYRDKGIVVLATVIDWKGEIRANTKTRISKPLPIIPELEEALAPRRLGKFVFTTVKGKPYRKRRLEDIWDSAMQEAIKAHPNQVQRVSLYQGLKHSFGGQRINAGASIDVIAEIMGHTDSRTTKKYAKLKMERLAEVMSLGAPWVKPFEQNVKAQ